jgi:hypothetical protein
VANKPNWKPRRNRAGKFISASLQSHSDEVVKPFKGVAARSSKRKPGMPKMPWNKEKSND